MLDLPTIQHAWHLAPITSTRNPETGTVHQTLLITTTTAAYALRAYRFTQEQRWRIEYEHELIQYVASQGLPALAPLPLAGSTETIFSYHGHFYALFPFATGYQSRSERFTPAELTALGSFLAQLHLALHDYPQSRVYQRDLYVDSTKTLTKMQELETTIRTKPVLDSVDRAALRRLGQQRRCLEQSTVAHGSVDLSGLECQVIHGDYQEANLFFRSDPATQQTSISAIIDWDQAYYAPRAWEVIRTLHYACELEPSFCALVLSAYRNIQPLAQADLEQAAIAYSQLNMHSLWIYETYYLEGNMRVADYFKEDFVPYIVGWNKVQRLSKC